jgi:hypothetical protein
MKISHLFRGLMVLATIAAGFSANTAFAAIHPSIDIEVRRLAASIYGDAECAAVLFTANPELLTMTDSRKIVASKLVKPKNSACAVLSSYVRPQNTSLVSHDIIAAASASTTHPVQFEVAELPSIQKTYGDSEQRYGDLYEAPEDVRFSDRAREPLLTALYGVDRAEDMMAERKTFAYDPSISSVTSTWYTRIASVLGADAEFVIKTAYNTFETEDGTVWSFDMDGFTYVNGKKISDIPYIGDRFVLHPISGHWFFVVDDTLYTDQGTYAVTGGELDGDPWMLKDGSMMYTVRRGEGDAVVYDLMKNGTLVATYDWIDEISYVKRTEDVAYRVRVGEAWHIVNAGVDEAAWTQVGALATDANGSTIAYRARSADGAWHIVFKGGSPALSWEPTSVRLNPITKTPIATDDLGHVWTPEKEWKLVSRPYVFDVSETGHLLMQALDYPSVPVAELWVDDTSLGVYGKQWPSSKDPNFSDASASEVYAPGYVATYLFNMSLDTKNRLVVYRQEGLIFTRSVYEIK